MNFLRAIRFLVIICVVLLAACSNEVDRSNPEEVVRAWMHAVAVARDREEAASFIVPATREFFLAEWEQTQDFVERLAPRPAEVELQIAITDDRAQVDAENWDVGAPIHLKREGRTWWVAY